ncbi:MAG TPA: MBL fold metallo-hydrolase [Pseudomonadales bacterium]
MRTALLAAACCAASTAFAQADMAAAARHVENARTAAGQDHAFIFGRLCEGPITAVGAPPPVGEVPAALPNADPAIGEWYAAPAQVFDDLYFLGQTVFSVWALRTSEGFILVDAIFDYSVEAEVIDGMRKLGLNPEDIKYVIISHAHADHSGGAAFLQRFGAKIVMSEVDWELYERTHEDKATRDIVATDGMEITLGDHTVRTYITPGHTHGTLSTLLPVHDNGTPHLAALWGGTLFNFRDAPDDPRDTRLGMYAESAKRFRGIATDAGVDILLSNHTAYDGTTAKLPRLAERAANAPHPYVIGKDAASRYFTVAEECALAARIAESQAK